MRVPESICNYLEGMIFDLEGTKDLIAFLLRDSLVNKEALSDYKLQYDELYVKCELLKKEITQVYANGNPHWTLDFITGELTFREGCSCGNK